MGLRHPVQEKHLSPEITHVFPEMSHASSESSPSR